MDQLFLSPPIVFIILLLCGVFFSLMVSYLAPPSAATIRKSESYACGQRNVDHMVSPDYEQFFPFAFFFFRCSSAAFSPFLQNFPYIQAQGKKHQSSHFGVSGATHETKEECP